MGILRPATPGFLVTLAAAALLAVVSFSVPYFKSVFFLKASLADEGVNGSITFGTLGYCIELSNGTTCSKPSVGYQLDINGLVGNDLPIKIPQVAVKWITYALVLHIVALVLAAISAVFGLLAHVREFSMVCFSTCISGFGAAVALIAFIFDLAFFFIAKSRINSVKGGSATMGIAIWLTLAAWLCLFFAGCFFGLGRCCVSRRPRGIDKQAPSADQGYAEQMRLDAVKAEADRKARQQRQEIGLPAFQEYDQTQPLTKMDPEEYIEEGDHILPYRPNQPGVGAGVGAGMAAYARNGASPPGGIPHSGGYSQAPPGNRAVDDYYNARPSQPNAYPPQPRRQTSGHTQTSSSYSAYSTSPPPIPPVPPVPTIPPPGANSQYLAAGGAYGHNQYASAASQPYAHPARSATYMSAQSHQQYPTEYSAYAQEPSQGFNADVYNATGHIAMPSSTAYTTPYAPNSSYGEPSQAVYTMPNAAPERSYTLGGDNYAPATGTTAENPYADDAYYARYSGTSQMTSPYSPLPTPSASHMDTQVAPTSALPSPGVATTPRGPRSPTSLQPAQAEQHPVYEDSPPMYDDATAQPPGQWGAKR